jgi:spore maturation protein CgeB
MDELLKRVESSRVLLVGPGWERYGVPTQSIAWGPLLNAVYGLGRVCVNLHNDEQSLGGEVQVDANNRLFDLAMAGRPQVCNAPAVVERYFSQDEVPSYADPDTWAEAVVRLVSDTTAASGVANAAQSRARREHTWDARAITLAAAVEDAIGRRAPRSITNGWVGATRVRDTMLPAYGPAELARKIGRRIGRVFDRQGAVR